MPYTPFSRVVSILWRSLATGRLALNRLEQNVLRPVPQHVSAERAQVFKTLNDSEKMISSERSGFAGEGDVAIRQQDFGFADAAWVEDNLARRRITCRILIRQPEVEVAEWDPAALAAPAHVNDAL